MNNITRRIISMLLTVCLLFLATVPTFAAEDEEYLSDLRLIYADSFEEAGEILASSELEGYKLFDANLNANTGKTGVWLAYKTTTDIEDAITDIAVMQMNGGYNEGNYQQMIQQSLEEYKKMGENYLAAIDYFREGYEAGNYLSEIAFRQLNFYNVVTEGIEEIPEFEGERLGDIFIGGIDVADLATMFMQGNLYALQNVRSLLAMGVSYNEDGKTYLEKVAGEAEKYNADNTIYDNEDYTELASMIATELSSISNMLKELEANEPDINWDDEEISELEMQYLDVKLVSVMLGQVAYTADKTLYDFVIEYVYSENDYSALYPLVAALNDGQIALTRVAHYYDVVRYSMTLETNEDIETELANAEAEYGDYPFNIYEGVDRTIFYDTFALTSAAYRADAFTESGLSAALYGGENSTLNYAATAVGGVGAALFAAGFIKHAYHRLPAWRYAFTYGTYRNQAYELVAKNGLFSGNGIPIPDDQLFATSQEAISHFKGLFMEKGFNLPSNFDSMTFQKQVETLYRIYEKNSSLLESTDFYNFHGDILEKMNGHENFLKAHDAIYGMRNNMSSGALRFVYSAYIVGGLMMLASAVTLGVQIYNYYHPEYTDIPTAMVDLIDTKDGDRYIKYDVVYEAEPQADGTLIAADLNAFQANRWNAMYFTKSYEAGKPLLADEFVLSTTSNVPGEKHMPVHRFGEVVSYNLNKYNFNDDHTIYLSVKQSDNQKAAVERVPELIGSVFGTGYYILAGGAGAILGAGGTVGAKAIIKRRKTKKNVEAEATE